ncbi:holo-ACP synthase [Patescibacteria group bacterium AH-259-L07]|nr:holo-ACP synthase [Patescibacteria group bacterium AH-259-L07]
MEITIGCDHVNIKKFKKSVQRGGGTFLNKIFSPHELVNARAEETLAGLFAAKEAVIKALALKAGDWHKIEIVKNESGRPEVKLLGLEHKIVSQDISISHDGEYAFAVAVFLFL